MPRLSNAAISAAARAMNRKRKVRAGGRPKVLRPCPNCGARLGAVELRQHAPHCPGRLSPPRRRGTPARGA